MSSSWVRASIQRVGRAVEQEAEALGQVAQVGGLAVQQEEEQQPAELRVAQPGVGFLGALELPDRDVVRAERDVTWLHHARGEPHVSGPVDQVVEDLGWG